MDRSVLLPLALLAACSAGAPAPRWDPADPGDPADPRDPDGWARRDGGTAPPPDPDTTCDRIAVDARAEAATVMIVLDRSGSMYDFERGGEGVDRWTPSVMAIESVTTALDGRVAFGLMLFSSDDECGAGRVAVPPGMGNAARIRAELSGDPHDSTGGGTPTAASLLAARRELAAVPGQKFVLLVTDGAPNCNDGLDPYSCRCTAPAGECWAEDCLDDARSVAAVRSLRESGIPTFVIGYDTGMWAPVMDRMAAEGGTRFTAHLPVSDRASLEVALREIGGSVVSCSHDLSMPPGDVAYVRVTVDGSTVAHESRAPGAGWRLDGDRTITLLGPDCARIQDGAPHSIEVTVECEPVIF